MLHIAIRWDEDVANWTRYNTTMTMRQQMDYVRQHGLRWHGSAGKIRGYKIGKTEYDILKMLVPDAVDDIPRKKLTNEYRYIIMNKSDDWFAAGQYFVVKATPEKVQEIEKISRNWFFTSSRLYNDRVGSQYHVYLAKEGKWYAFPQREKYDTGQDEEYTVKYTETTFSFGGRGTTNEPPVEKSYTSTRAIYDTRDNDYVEVKISIAAPNAEKIAAKATIVASDDNPAGYPTRIVGNGMVLEWKQGYEDKPHCWWLKDEIPARSKNYSITYKNYDQIKNAYGAKWSKTFSSWYCSGNQPPQAWLDLVEYGKEPVASTVLQEPIQYVVEYQLEEFEKKITGAEAVFVAVYDEEAKAKEHATLIDKQKDRTVSVHKYPGDHHSFWTTYSGEYSHSLRYFPSKSYNGNKVECLERALEIETALISAEQRRKEEQVKLEEQRRLAALEAQRLKEEKERTPVMLDDVEMF